MVDGRDGSRKAVTDLTPEYAELRILADVANQLADAQLKKNCENLAREPSRLRNLFKALESELLQEHKKWLVD